MPEIGYADLYQLASVVAVEFAGGPAIPFRLGRKVCRSVLPVCLCASFVWIQN